MAHMHIVQHNVKLLMVLLTRNSPHNYPCLYHMRIHVQALSPICQHKFGKNRSLEQEAESWRHRKKLLNCPSSQADKPEQRKGLHSLRNINHVPSSFVACIQWHVSHSYCVFSKIGKIQMNCRKEKQVTFRADWTQAYSCAGGCNAILQLHDPKL